MFGNLLLFQPCEHIYGGLSVFGKNVSVNFHTYVDVGGPSVIFLATFINLHFRYTVGFYSGLDRCEVYRCLAVLVFCLFCLPFF